MATKKMLAMDSSEIKRALRRIASEIIEKNNGTNELAIVGMVTKGVFLGNRLVKEINCLEDVAIPMGVLDTTLYRDDVNSKNFRPRVEQTEINFDINGKKIILVDDVIYTGRTVRAALDALMDFGRPQCIQLAVMIDRGHRELPISADYLGKLIETRKDEQVLVAVKEIEKEDMVYIVKDKKKSVKDGK